MPVFEYIVENGEVTVKRYIGCQKELVIPNELDGYPVRIIGFSAFQGCAFLERITVPDSVTMIRECAFSGCKALKHIVLPKGIRVLEAHLFDGCSSLTEITIPDSVWLIGECAFRGCTSLKSILIPIGVTAIGDCAFYQCDNITIYCQAERRGERWSVGWKTSVRPVVWGVKG
jgi:hypothetical protein